MTVRAHTATGHQTVVLVRHAEQEPRPGDPGLTGRGRRQAEDVAAHLAGLEPVLLVASPQLRARRTALPLAAATGLPVSIDDRLQERVNLEADDDPEVFLAEWRRSTADRDWSRPGRRSSRAAGRAMRAAVEEHAVGGGTAVLVTHGGATVDLLRTLLGDAALERRSPGLIAVGPSHGALTTLTRDGAARWQAIAIATTAHLR